MFNVANPLRSVNGFYVYTKVLGDHLPQVVECCHISAGNISYFMFVNRGKQRFDIRLYNIFNKSEIAPRFSIPIYGCRLAFERCFYEQWNYSCVWTIWILTRPEYIKIPEAEC